MTDAIRNSVLVLLVVAVIGLYAMISSRGQEPQNEETLGAISGPNVHFPMFFGASVSAKRLTQGGGVFASTTNAAADTTSLTAANLADYNVFRFVGSTTPTGVAAVSALAATIQASTSWTTLLPDAGDMREWILENGYTTAATTTTWTAGTGIILLGVTTADDVTDGGETSRLTCWRKANTDIACIVSELLDAD